MLKQLRLRNFKGMSHIQLSWGNTKFGKSSEKCILHNFSQSFDLNLKVNVVGFIKKVLVGPNYPKWKIFWEGLIFNCPGVTQNLGNL